MEWVEVAKGVSLPFVNAYLLSPVASVANSHTFCVFLISPYSSVCLHTDAQVWPRVFSWCNVFGSARARGCRDCSQPHQSSWLTGRAFVHLTSLWWVCLSLTSGETADSQCLLKLLTLLVAGFATVMGSALLHVSDGPEPILFLGIDQFTWGARGSSSHFPWHASWHLALRIPPGPWYLNVIPILLNLPWNRDWLCLTSDHT